LRAWAWACAAPVSRGHRPLPSARRSTHACPGALGIPGHGKAGDLGLTSDVESSGSGRHSHPGTHQSCPSRAALPRSHRSCCPSSIGFPLIGEIGWCRMSWRASPSGRSWCRRAWPMPVSLACRPSWGSIQSSRH
jgi:hypothetical protein